MFWCISASSTIWRRCVSSTLYAVNVFYWASLCGSETFGNRSQQPARILRKTTTSDLPPYSIYIPVISHHSLSAFCTVDSKGRICAGVLQHERIARAKALWAGCPHSKSLVSSISCSPGPWDLSIPIAWTCSARCQCVDSKGFTTSRSSLETQILGQVLESSLEIWNWWTDGIGSIMSEVAYWSSFHMLLACGFLLCYLCH